MRTRFFTVLLCLLAFGAELVLDNSTAFVRSEPPARTGKLVLEKTHPAALPGVPVGDAPFTDEGNTVAWWSNTNVHAGHLPVIAEFKVIVAVSELTHLPNSLYASPSLNTLTRPPSA